MLICVVLPSAGRGVLPGFHWFSHMVRSSPHRPPAAPEFPHYITTLPCVVVLLAVVETFGLSPLSLIRFAPGATTNDFITFHYLHHHVRETYLSRYTDEGEF